MSGKVAPSPSGEASPTPEAGNEVAARASEGAMPADKQASLLEAFINSNLDVIEEIMATYKEKEDWDFQFTLTGSLGESFGDLSPLCIMVHPALCFLSRASRAVRIEMVHRLLDRGVDPIAYADRPNHVGNWVQPLMLAAQEDDRDLFSLLLKKACQIHTLSESQILSATFMWHRKMKGESGYTYLMHCALHGSLELLEYLLSLGVEVNQKTSSGMTALHFALQAPQSSGEGAAELLAAGAEAFPKLKNGVSAFSCAIVKAPLLARQMLEAKYRIKHGVSGASVRCDFSEVALELDGSEARYNPDPSTALGSMTGKAVKEESFQNALELVLASDALPVISSPVFRCILNVHWKAYGSRMFKQAMGEHMAMLFFFILAASEWPSDSPGVQDRVTPGLFVPAAAAEIMSLRLAYTEAVCARKRGLSTHFSNPWSYFNGILFAMTQLVVLDWLWMALTGDEAGLNWRALSAIVCLMGTLKFVQFSQVPQSTGHYVVMVKLMLVDMLGFAAFFSVFVVAYTVSYSILLEGATHSSTNHVSLFFNMIEWVLGTGDTSVLTEVAPVEQVFAQALYLTFLLLGAVLLLNLLIAQMSNTYTSVAENQEGYWLAGRASELLNLKCRAGEVAQAACLNILSARNRRDLSAQQEGVSEEVPNANWAYLLRKRFEEVATVVAASNDRLARIESQVLAGKPRGGVIRRRSSLEN